MKIKLTRTATAILILAMCSSFEYCFSRKNITIVVINKDHKLLVEDDAVPLRHLCDSVKVNLLYLYRYGQHSVPRDPIDYSKVILSLQTDRGASYDFFIAANNEIEAAYKSIWEDVSYLKFQKSLKNLTPEERDAVERYFPKVISEADTYAYW
ncbi:MAG: hypothetical protein SchgKO_23420 [Schleiferiaceae bacterium]